MLFTLLIGLISAGVYGLRSLFLKLRFVLSGGRADKDDDDSTVPFAIFTDSKRYWNIFEPICDEFERREQSIRYLTASPDDPALEKNYEHVKCDFVGEGNKAFARLNMLQADIVLSSTPGLDVYQWKRSHEVKWYAHILHAVSDAAMYRMFGIDFFDSVLLTGQYQVDQIRELERKREIPPKELPVVGLPYMDSMAKRLEDAVPLPSHPTTVLLAPSWGASSIFSLYGGSIIEALLATGYHIIVRPHPQSFESEAELMDKLMSEYPESDQLEWNRDNDNFEVLRRSDIMVSDFSGVVFDYTLVFDRPVIYTEPSYNVDPYDAWWLDDLWTFKTLPKIGRELTMDGVGNLKELIDECLADPRFQKGRDEARDECWACRGTSAQVVADYLIAKREELLAEGD